MSSNFFSLPDCFEAVVIGGAITALLLELGSHVTATGATHAEVDGGFLAG